MVWNIVCDSSCDLRATDVKSESVQFETVPLRLQVGAREFLDNDQLEVPDLLQANGSGKIRLLHCHRPSPAAFARAFEKGRPDNSALPFPPISPAPITPR